MTGLAARDVAPTAETLIRDAIQALGELEQDWPVGLAIRHVDGTWTGTVHLGDPDGTDPNTPGALHTGAHTLLWADAYAATAVCVRYELDGWPVVAWYSPRVLRRVRRSR